LQWDIFFCSSGYMTQGLRTEIETDGKW